VNDDAHAGVVTGPGGGEDKEEDEEEDEEEEGEEEERCGALSRLRLKQATTFITISEIVYRLVPYLDTFGRLNDRRNDVKVEVFFYHF